ncbi:MAG: GNAT family N-acetyltransferase [Pseudomonadota bacterium]
MNRFAHLDTFLLNGYEYRSYVPGALADVIALHMIYYAREWKFGAAFETKLAAELSEFLVRFNPEKHLFLNIYRENNLSGSITIDGDDPEGAHLRWFITSDSERGTGLGRALMACAIDFSKGIGAEKVWLTTFVGLQAAQHLYENFGFELVSEEARDQWNGGVQERRYELILDY